ncbi:MAG TPA: Hsp20/alpha crystallin family protein [Solirubrobacteraceae bacterium]|jgi:HSP20 family protein|nr:Hsp20/alpha crystallin family protein [Solirubrobacteraceae bacterium]
MSIPIVHRGQQSHPTAEPFRDLEEMQQRTLALLQRAFGDGLGDGGAWVPAVDIEETEDAWIVEAELPGVKRHDVDIEVHENELQISGEIKERERTGILRRRTRRVGRFEYRVTLPTAIDQDSIAASLDDGVLTIRIPKPESARRHRIEIAEPASG